MAEAPAVYETLSPDDAGRILEELLEAQNQAHLLGLMMNVKPRDVEAIQETYQQPKDRLLHVIIAFLQQAEPRPTWRAIVEALKSPVVGLTALARRLESTHFPDDPTSTRDIAPPTDAKSATAPSNDKIQLEPSLSSSLPSSPRSPVSTSGTTLASVEGVKEKVKGFRRRFDAIKMSTIECLEKCKMAVKTVVFLLMSIKAVDEHKMFLKKEHKTLHKCEDHWELFGNLNLYWNYLAFDLLEQLIEVLTLKHAEFDPIASEMASYKGELEDFRRSTALELFCLAEASKLEANIPESFKEMVVQFEWPGEVNLEMVEEFRQRYAQAFNLDKCAMLIYSIRAGSFTVTWLLPDSVLDRLTKTTAPVQLFRHFRVIRLDIDGKCFYKMPVAPSLTPTSSGSLENKGSPAKSGEGKEEMDEYRFVEQPSEDFFCPVTMGLLLQPHLTSCCGKHLSQEAAAKIRREKLPCPLCKKAQWNTMLDKRFRREVNALHVCCRHEGRGCGWQGEMTTFHTHIKSCPMGCDAPLNTSDDRATLGPGPEDFNVTEKSQAEETNDSFYVPEGPLYVALYDFEQRTSESLAFSKGEKLEIISEEEGDWWRARSLNSLKEGYIPRQYVAKCDTLAAEDWYFGNIRKREAERLLQIHHVRGMFLVRESESKLGDFTLSLYDGDNVKHYHIRRPDDEAIYHIVSRAVFKSIRELIEHYSKDSDGLPTTLTAPFPRLEKPQIDLSHKTQKEWEIARDSIAFGRKLGCGWFGEVWEGKWNQIMPVAIRTFKNGIIEPQPFRQEAALMKTLQHPNLVQLYAICTQEEPLMMIMELVSQGSLLEFLQKGEGRSLKVPGLIDMAVQVAAGMEYLEERGFIHGDLAARNVLVNGHLNICKISDFGLSRLIKYDKEDDFDDRTRRLPIKWMAPEAALYNRFTTRSDVWSFGVLLTELLTHGRIPYPGMSNSEVLQKLQDGYRMPPPPNTPDSIYQIMLDTWKENPEDRHTFEAIKWRLEDFLISPDISYREPETG